MLEQLKQGARLMIGKLHYYLALGLMGSIFFCCGGTSRAPTSTTNEPVTEQATETELVDHQTCGCPEDSYRTPESCPERSTGPLSDRCHSGPMPNLFCGCEGDQPCEGAYWDPDGDWTDPCEQNPSDPLCE